jgi:hypothetical protein
MTRREKCGRPYEIHGRALIAEPPAAAHAAAAEAALVPTARALHSILQV